MQKPNIDDAVDEHEEAPNEYLIQRRTALMGLLGTVLTPVSGLLSPALAQSSLEDAAGIGDVLAEIPDMCRVSTSTIEGPFGSGLTVNGMYLNNELTDFSFEPMRDGVAVANRVEGGKRPRSSMSPTIVYGPDGRVRLAVGAAGGATIIAQVAKAIIGVVD